MAQSRLRHVLRLLKLGRRSSRLGRRGERVAARYFERQGYAIVAKNWRHGSLEIDLVVRKGRKLCFVEVKTRLASCSPWSSALDAIDDDKERFILDAAECFLRAHPHEARRAFSVHYEVVGVLVESSWWGIRTRYAVSRYSDALD